MEQKNPLFSYDDDDDIKLKTFSFASFFDPLGSGSELIFVMKMRNVSILSTVKLLLEKKG